jgi:hypothetical protein
MVNDSRRIFGLRKHKKQNNRIDSIHTPDQMTARSIARAVCGMLLLFFRNRIPLCTFMKQIHLLSFFFMQIEIERMTSWSTVQFFCQQSVLTTLANHKALSWGGGLQRHFRGRRGRDEALQDLLVVDW